MAPETSPWGRLGSCGFDVAIGLLQAFPTDGDHPLQKGTTPKRRATKCSVLSEAGQPSKSSCWSPREEACGCGFDVPVAVGLLQMTMPAVPGPVSSIAGDEIMCHAMGLIAW
eukprot:CAMPEP_0204308908 /NCGR_PEP_ID=MMETSP0469-20131031/793_1 /ASSEMBLY_ACC=CAM_ASM_000384 /TAXON_ID=2969 /ORGANISM="Oxyrrhis marina" /LENGTH=111 /DNA_ID=CAMNT_0051288461 /DNA_START=156 /DNA_END=488 /DNA_ORIENTATION=-